MIAPATSLVEGDGTIDFELAATAVNARTAEIISDFGLGRESESYRVSTVSNGDENFITAENALSEILRIPYEQGTAPFRRTADGPVGMTEPMLTSVRNLGTDDETSSSSATPWTEAWTGPGPWMFPAWPLLSTWSSCSRQVATTR